MRVRSFTNRGSTTKVIGKFPSSKTGKTVWWESQLERDLIYLLEFDKDVITYREQPLRISYTLDGRRHLYTPDFLAERPRTQDIIEVKYEEDAIRPENDRLFKAVAPVCHEAGYNFLVATETVIRQQPRLDIVKLLTRYSRVPVEPRHVIYCHELMRRRPPLRLTDVLAFFEGKGESRATVYALIYHDHLRIDLTQPLVAGAFISTPDVDSADHRKVM